MGKPDYQKLFEVLEKEVAATIEAIEGKGVHIDELKQLKAVHCSCCVLAKKERNSTPYQTVSISMQEYRFQLD